MYVWVFVCSLFSPFFFLEPAVLFDVRYTALRVPADSISDYPVITMNPTWVSQCFQYIQLYTRIDPTSKAGMVK